MDKKNAKFKPDLKTRCSLFCGPVGITSCLIPRHDDDEIDTFADAGLDYDELEFMDPDERREVLEDAGLDPDGFDF